MSAVRYPLPSLEEFLSEVPARRGSPEVDFGWGWRSGGSSWPTYRISWVEATGDVYAFQPSGLGGLGAGYVLKLGTAPTRAAVDAALAGWEDMVGQPNGLLWVRERLQEAAL